MRRRTISKLARGITWGIFLLVSIVLAGASLVPANEFKLAGMFQAVLLFSGIPIVAVAEFHIQRYELSATRESFALFVLLLTLPFSYYFISGVSAHTELETGWFALGIWLFLYVGLISLVQRTRLEWWLMLGMIMFIAAGCVLLLFLSLWLWPKIYYEYVMPEDHLGLTPYLMIVVGLLLWGLLASLNHWIRLVVQRRTESVSLRENGG